MIKLKDLLFENEVLTSLFPEEWMIDSLDLIT